MNAEFEKWWESEGHLTLNYARFSIKDIAKLAWTACELCQLEKQNAEDRKGLEKLNATNDV